MEVFCWNPRSPAETLQEFNQRLEDYCVANPVLDVSPSTGLGVFAISLTNAEDAGLDQGACLIPRVILVPSDQVANLERFLGTEIEALADQDAEDNPYIPFKATLHEVAGVLLALVLIGGGEIAPEVDANGGDLDDPGTGAIPPAIRGGKR